MHGIKNGEEKKLSRMECWMLFLSTKDGEVLEMLARQNDEMKRAVEALQAVSRDPNIRRRYEKREKQKIIDRRTFRRDWKWRGLRRGPRKNRTET